MGKIIKFIDENSGVEEVSLPASAADANPVLKIEDVEGIVIKDDTDGKYYKIHITSGTITSTLYYDPGA